MPRVGLPSPPMISVLIEIFKYSQCILLLNGNLSPLIILFASNLYAVLSTKYVEISFEDTIFVF